MRDFEGTATARIEAAPEAVFNLITDIERLPEWNAAIEAVIEQPASLSADAEWVVVMHPPRLPRWNSRSRVEELDRSRLRFAYRTQTDDGNPTFVIWTWEIAAAEDGAQVTVRWQAHPKTIGRILAAPVIRRPQLRREVPASLAAIDHIITTPRSAA
jgi:uncharacterized protein YndB with AHSA1/START domain